MGPVFVIYTIVIYRIRKERYSLHQHVLATESTYQRQKGENERRGMRLNMATLGIIVGVTSAALIPRELVVISSLFVDWPDKLHGLLNKTNVLPILNTLFDTLIYVVRIPEVRNRIKEKCRICNKNRANPVEHTTSMMFVVPRQNEQSSSVAG